MKLYNVTDNEFLQYGKVIDIQTEELVREAQKITFHDVGSTYIASVEAFEGLTVMDELQNEYFGTLATQLGYCCGHNDALNALEWHTCSEINVGVTNLILLLGDVRELEEGVRYNSENVKAFLLKKGQAIEVYSTTLHFCPLEVDKNGFGCVVGLLKGTNTPLEKEVCDKRLFRKNKWIICHEDNKELLDKGIVGGIYGKNYNLGDLQ